MKTFVISLPDAAVRREKIKNNFFEKNINYELVNGVDKKDLIFLKDLSGFYFQNNLFKINSTNHKLYTNRSWFRYGEIANVFAHYQIWKKVSNDSEPNCLICEDDCYPSKNFTLDLLNQFDLNVNEFIYLQATTAHYQNKNMLISDLPNDERNSKLKKITKNKNIICEGTAAYCISKGACKKLCDYLEVTGFDGPIDNLISRLSDFNLFCPSDIDNYFYLDDTSKFSYTHHGQFGYKYTNGDVELNSTFEVLFKD